MAHTGTATASTSPATRRTVITTIAGVVLPGAIALDTKVVTIGGNEDLRQQAFDPDRL